MASELPPVLCGRCLQLRLAQPARATFFPNVDDESPLCTIHWQEKVTHPVTVSPAAPQGDTDLSEISVLLSAAQLDLIQRAATVCQVSVEQFLLDAALLRARLVKRAQPRPVESVRPL